MPQNRWMFATAGLALCGLCCPFSTPGSRFTVDHWTTDNGLPENSVIAVTQTRDGYLWLGTLRGLARFDGIRFKTYNDGNTPGLTNSRVLRLYEDGRTNLWVG